MTWLIELHNGEDSRFNEHFINKAFMPVLDAVERHWREQWREAQATKSGEGGGGALIIVGKRKQNKFFSNGAWLACYFASKRPTISSFPWKDLIMTTWSRIRILPQTSSLVRTRLSSLGEGSSIHSH